MKAASARISILATADPGTPARVLDQLAQRAILPRAVTMACLGDMVQMDVQLDPIADHALDLLVEKMRALIAVAKVRVTRNPAMAGGHTPPPRMPGRPRQDRLCRAAPSANPLVRETRS
ncbi:hypothetical protein GVO57_02905 [Sphingomonas changnyeongensis]|uniref:ACT domain-containing protein n=1 Tax=Sphingomonas changnyeongensis TaxID=2698679 RepID=A0A7Z2S7T5_9SPHN|nr:hypothetical protein [Sphingomonas changnyeongensis]QHL89967.1 hypothetical protein GVO57_02905 [Sphingomonas changnyeongensis]